MAVIHGWNMLSHHLSLSKPFESRPSWSRGQLSPFIAFSLFCRHVQSPCVSRSWRRRLWCRRRGTVVSGRHGPKTWPRRPPNPLPDARTPEDLRCPHGNCPRASPDGRCQHRACGLWRHRGNIPGSGDGEARRWEPAAGSWSMSGLRKTMKAMKVCVHEVRDWLADSCKCRLKFYILLWASNLMFAAFQLFNTTAYPCESITLVLWRHLQADTFGSEWNVWIPMTCSTACSRSPEDEMCKPSKPVLIFRLFSNCFDICWCNAVFPMSRICYKHFFFFFRKFALPCQQAADSPRLNLIYHVLIKGFPIFFRQRALI